MRNKRLLTLLGGVCLVVTLVALPFMAACAKPAPAPAPAPTPAPAPAPAPGPPPHPEVEIEIYSAKFGGVNYVMGAGFADLITKKHPWLRAMNIETGGAMANVKLNVDDPERKAKSLRAETGSVFWMATRGHELFDRTYDLKYLFTYAVAAFLFVTDDPNIRTWPDMAGKKVGVGEAGSSFIAESQFMLKHSWGIWDDIQPEYLGFGAAKDAFMDGLIDVVFCPTMMVGPNKWIIHPLMSEALRLKTLYIIGLTQAEFERGRLGSGWPVPPAVIPAGAFADGLPAEDTVSFVTTLGLCAYPEVDEEIAYEVVKMAHQNMEKFGEFHGSAKVMTPEIMAWLPAGSEDEVHPGALKYYREQGIKLSIGGATPFD